MLRFALEKVGRAPFRILCLGAHSDDIEIGCGGTILTLLATHRNLEFCWVVFSSGPGRAVEARRSANIFLKGAARKEISILDFRDGFFPFRGEEIKESFERLKSGPSPDLILTHSRDDLHQDHRVLNQFTWNTWRNHLILEYEIPKYDGDLGAPGFFVPFGRKTCDRKIKILLDCFRSQRDKHWFTRDTFEGLMRIRGMEANSPGRFAEAFYVRKLVLDA